jgi:hypothetical protein
VAAVPSGLSLTPLRIIKKITIEFLYWQDFSLLRVVQTGSGAHPASNPTGIGGSFPGVKAAGEKSSPLTSNLCRVQEYMDLNFQSPYIFIK